MHSKAFKKGLCSTKEAEDKSVEHFLFFFLLLLLWLMPPWRKGLVLEEGERINEVVFVCGDCGACGVSLVPLEISSALYIWYSLSWQIKRYFKS